MLDVPTFLTARFPVLYTMHPVDPVNGLDPVARVDLAILVHGMPSFIGTREFGIDEVHGVVASLQAGDARIAVSGARTSTATGSRPLAFVSLVCADGRNVPVARIPARRRDESPETLARYVMEQIARGVQVPDVFAGAT